MLSTREFFDLIFPDFHHNRNLVALRKIKGAHAQNILCRTLDDLMQQIAVAQAAGDWNIYFQCAELKPGSQSARKENCLRHNAIFADFDPEEKHNKQVVRVYSKSELMDRIKALPLEPSIVVDSGRGYHVYWLLNAPLYDQTALRAILLRIAKDYNTDPKAALATQVLRVPGTMNLKGLSTGQGGVPVSIVSFNQTKYSLAQIKSSFGINQSDIEAVRQAPAKRSRPQTAKAQRVYRHGEVVFDFSRRPEPLNRVVDSYGDLVNAIKEMNILHLSNQPAFPLGMAFHCCLHDDANPSANVYLGQNSTYYYHCFGCQPAPSAEGPNSEQNTHHNIISFTQAVKGLSYREAVLFLTDFFGIRCRHQNWLTQEIGKYRRNLDLITAFESGSYAEAYPELHKYLGTRLQYLRLINEFAYSRLGDDDHQHGGSHLFFFGLRWLAEQHKLNHLTLHRTITLFAALGLLKKVPLDEVPDQIRAVAIQQWKQLSKQRAVHGRQTKVFPVNFYTLPDLSTVLSDANQMATKMTEHNFTMRFGTNCEFFTEHFGDATAKKIYPNQRTAKNESASIERRMESTLKKLIACQGYATKEQVIAKTKVSGRLNVSRDRKQKELNLYFKSLLERNSLTYKPVNKAIRERFGLKLGGYVILPTSLDCLA